MKRKRTSLAAEERWSESALPVTCQPPDKAGWLTLWRPYEGGWFYCKIYPAGTKVSELPEGEEIQRVYSDGSLRI